MRRMFTAAFAAVLAFAAAPSFAQAAKARIVAYEGARLIVGDGGAPIENGVLLVEGTRIVQAGAARAVTVPGNATRVNLSGKTVMPMLIDTHTHLSQTEPELIADLRRRAYFGVSAALGMGHDVGEAPFKLRAGVPAGAARYFTAGRGITAPEKGRPVTPYWVSTDAEARKAVQENAAKKVDIIKIWVDDRGGVYQRLTPSLFGAIIDEAHKNGVRATAHIVFLEDAKGLLRAGVDAFAHGVRDKDIDEEFMALLKTRPNLVLNPNLASRGVKTDISWLKASLPAAEYAKLEASNKDEPSSQGAYALQARNLVKMNGAGVTMVLGSDGNTPWAPHVEMEDMVLAGMTTQQVITAATKNGAEFLRIPDAGTLQAGKSADFIVLDANPLEDIKNTRKIEGVYLRGAAVDRTAYP